MVIWDISEYGDRLKNSNKISENQGIKLKADEFFSAKNNEIPFVNCVAVSAIESSHRNLVTDMHWIPNSLEVSVITMTLLYVYIIIRYSWEITAYCSPAVIGKNQRSSLSLWMVI